jgi:ABC-2 type transport system ATP-binding protein
MEESSLKAVHCSGLTKTYVSYKKQPGLLGSIRSLIKRKIIQKTALHPLDLEIYPGEIVGLLGGNGAGKTTLMKMLSGIITPSHGDVRVFSHIPWKRENPFKKRIALAMGQKNQLQWDLPAQDSFNLIKEYYNISDRDYRERLEHLTELLDVSEILNIQVRRLSLGERMKVEIMACMLHAPDLILLDEPTIGLDANAQERIRQFFRDYHTLKAPCILLTSHYMADIVALCPRVVLLSEGKKLFDGKREKLMDILGNNKRLHLIFEKSTNIPHHHPLIDDYNPHWKNKTEVTLDIDRDDFREVSARLLHQLPVSDFSTEEVPFEAVMEQIIKTPEILSRL